MVVEAGVPGRNHRLTQSHWQLSHMHWVGLYIPREGKVIKYSWGQCEIFSGGVKYPDSLGY